MTTLTAIAPTTEVIRLMRNSTEEEIMVENYVKAAATRGLSRFTIIRRHILHNALPYYSQIRLTVFYHVNTDDGDRNCFLTGQD